MADEHVVHLDLLANDEELLSVILHWNARPAAHLVLVDDAQNNITESGLAVAMQNAERVRIGVHVPNGACLQYLNVNRLRNLEISGIRTFPSPLRFFSHTSLHHLSVVNCVWMTSDRLLSLRRHLARLQTLELVDNTTNFEASQVAGFIRGHRALRRLTISLVLSGVHEVLGACPTQLEYLEVGDRIVNDSDVDVAEQCLKYLVKVARRADAPLPSIVIHRKRRVARIGVLGVRQRARLYLAALANLAEGPLGIVHNQLFG